MVATMNEGAANMRGISGLTPILEEAVSAVNEWLEENAFFQSEGVPHSFSKS
jgi:hypothetical protein